jgi:coenzyme F420 hydrogenase subunit beta
MSYQNLESSILATDLCASCGACALVCPQDMIGFDKDTVKPVLQDTEKSCGDCNDCVDVCPGLETDVHNQETRLFGRTRTTDERWLGVYQHVYGGKAKDPQIFEKSASGGSATALLGVAMKYLGAKHALVMGRDDEQPVYSSPALQQDPNQLFRYSQSTYQLAPYLRKLREIYDTDPEASVVMSGIACHVQAIRKLQCMDTQIGRWARDKIVFIVEIGCSSNTLPMGTQSLIREVMKVEVQDVVEVRFREGEYPGQIAVKTIQGEQHLTPFWKAVRHFKENKSFRCLSCGDWLSGLADVSVSDGDPNIFTGSLGIDQEVKHGRVFIRTKTAKEVMRFADMNNEIEIWPIDLVGLNLGLERKRNRRAHYESSGKVIPEGPIPGYKEVIEIIPDSKFLEVPPEAITES